METVLLPEVAVEAVTGVVDQAGAHQGGRFFGVEEAEFVVVGQDEGAVAAGEGFFEAFGFIGEGGDVGVVDFDRDAGRFQGGDDRQGRAFARIVDVAFVGHAKDCYHGVCHLFHQGQHPAGHRRRLFGVDRAPQGDEPRLFAEGADDKPGVHGDTVSAHARPGLVHIDPRVAVGQLDRFPGIDARLFADRRQFVGQGDVHVAKGVFDQLDHLRRIGIGKSDFALHEAPVEVAGFFCRGAVKPSDHAVVPESVRAGCCRAKPAPDSAQERNPRPRSGRSPPK